MKYIMLLVLEVFCHVLYVPLVKKRGSNADLTKMKWVIGISVLCLVLSIVSGRDFGSTMVPLLGLVYLIFESRKLINIENNGK